MTTAWNLLLYAVAKDKQELDLVNGAISDMHGATTAKQCNVAVQLHARSKRTTRHWISAGCKLRIETLPIEADAGDPSTLSNFLNAAHSMFPAEASALVLWAHGSGLQAVPASPPVRRMIGAAAPGVFGGAAQRAGSAMTNVFDTRAETSGPIVIHGHGDDPEQAGYYGPRWGPDPNTQQYLTSAGMKKAIAASSRHRVDVLGLNACSMASLEGEYELRSVSGVQVASQVDAEPWPYGAITAAIAAAPALTAEQLASAIVATVGAQITGPGQRSDAISALLSGALDELVNAFDAYAKRIIVLLENERDWKSLSKAIVQDAQRVDDPYQVDLMSLVETLGQYDAKAKAAAELVETKLRAAILANAASSGHPGVTGLSVFCPKSTNVDIPTSYKGMEFRSHSWVKFLQAFQLKLSRGRN